MKYPYYAPNKSTLASCDDINSHQCIDRPIGFVVSMAFLWRSVSLCVLLVQLWVVGGGVSGFIVRTMLSNTIYAYSVFIGCRVVCLWCIGAVSGAVICRGVLYYRQKKAPVIRGAFIVLVGRYVSA